MRLVENIENSYIGLSVTYVELTGNQSQNIDLFIAGLSVAESVNLDLYEWSFSDDAENDLEYKIYNMAVKAERILLSGLQERKKCFKNYGATSPVP